MEKLFVLKNFFFVLINISCEKICCGKKFFRQKIYCVKKFFSVLKSVLQNFSGKKSMWLKSMTCFLNSGFLSVFSTPGGFILFFHLRVIDNIESTAVVPAPMKYLSKNTIYN